ncbi:MAG: DUF342 domain-containing protein [Spirochaeta sp.]
MARKKAKSPGHPPQERRFSVFYQHGWVYLCIYPQSAENVYPDEIANRMRLLEMPRAELSRIREIIQAADGRKHALIEWPEGARLAAQISVHIAEDEMSASVYVTPPSKGAAPPTTQDLYNAMLEHGVRNGIDTAVLERITRQRQYETEITAAFGKDPVFGSGHRIRYHFNVDRLKPYLETDFGRMNLKELNFIEMVKKDQLLAELLPPVQPVDGITVTGTLLPAEADERTVELNPGPNTCLSQDKSRLYAECEGNVLLADDRVVVEEVIEVKNVDYSTGNIRFAGSVIIQGRVADGFEVEADGDIQVARGVGRASLRAGRNILLESGMNGNSIGSLCCDGDLYSKYLESCDVVCGGNLFLEEAVMHTTARVQNHCLLNGRRAEIIGGELLVGGCCWCKKLGNFSEQPTILHIGLEPGIVVEYRTAVHTCEQQQARLDELRTKQQQLEQAIRDGAVSEKIHAARDQLAEQAEHLAASIEVKRTLIPELRERMEEVNASRLIVEDTIFPGVSVWFGRHEYRAPDTGTRKTILQFRGDTIHESGFDARNKPKIAY